jgi:hypothetical protein
MSEVTEQQLEDALFTHQVRVTSADDLDDILAGWLAAAYAGAG